MLKDMIQKAIASRKALRVEPLPYERPGTTGDAFIDGCLEKLRTDGIVVIEKNVSPETCAQIVADFRSIADQTANASKYRDEHGLYERLASLHLRSAAARTIAFESRATKVVEAAFGKPYTAVGSLYFDKGSTQSIHRDTPAFFTNPLNHYVGVWTALEDIVPGSGPLMYFKRGHTVAPDLDLMNDPTVTADNYFDVVRQRCEEAGLELVEYFPRQGDTLIWHPQIPHGGRPIDKPGQSRRSIVFHFIPEGTPIYGPDTFFGVKGRVGSSRNYKTISFGRFSAIDQGAPRFFHNRYEGNFDEF